MATLQLNLSDSLFSQLQRRASEAKVSVEILAAEILARGAAPSSDDLSEEEIARRLALLDDSFALSNNRADRYPQGFKLDDSRETIYAGPESRGE